MAFGAEELRVLRRALALALHPGPASDEDVQDCHRLAESLDEALCEAARLRAFLVADLGRYRAALPGAAAGYLPLLEEVLATGHRPGPEDLAALRTLRHDPAAAALLARCQVLAEQDVRARLARRTPRQASVAAPLVPASRTRLLALPGGRSAEADGAPATGSDDAPREEPRKKPAERPAAPAPGPAPGPVKRPAPEPGRRPVPTPGEVFPRRRPTPAPPPAEPEQRTLAVG
ncbi:hypothetical protein [Streptomyces sp. DSM 15324]|uniref:hypothetical protein n=1 Tax=Streptomyces sp. DSM 15324 TaxID=1739111 RepID=UPI000747835B|nr:hypothetical protein [Streptomyces sp. DSM 15324]KUO08160.1 hypothetical protein AQJ58_31575 [Streptomyces sp. DSM 15324]